MKKKAGAGEEESKWWRSQLGTCTSTYNPDRERGIKSTTCLWGLRGGVIMVHFPEQLVDSIYRPPYWYQLIRHHGCQAPASWHTGLHLCAAGFRMQWTSPEATFMTAVCVGGFFFNSSGTGAEGEENLGGWRRECRLPETKTVAHSFQ